MRASSPAAMQPARPGPTRTAPPMMSPKYPTSGRYRSYIVFGACSVAFIFSSLILLRMVNALAAGPEAWAAVIESFRNPIYVIYHLLAIDAFLYTGWRFFFKLFGKSQPPRIGPLKPPPPAAFPPLFFGAWIAASLAVVVVAWGIFP